MASNVYFEGEIKSAEVVANNNGKILFEINGYCAEGCSSLIEEVNEFFPDFITEKGKNYLIADEGDLINQGNI